MKKLIFFLSLMLVINISYAQWTTSGTNTTTTNSIGIGTTNPGAKLDVQGGDINTSGSVTIGNNNGTATTKRLYLAGADGGHYLGSSGSGGNNFYFGEYLLNNSPTGFHWINTNGGGEVMTINGSGNVGIGTSNPNFRLTVSGNFQVTGWGPNYFNYKGGADLELSSADRGKGGRCIVHDFGNILTVNYNGDFTGGTKIGTQAFFSEPGGVSYVNGSNLLIGQTSQTNSLYKLDVKGAMRADQITVNTTGADFVFSPSYRLRSLASVHSYIEKNHHLPEIASADEMSKEGMEVGEMNKRLLQKVEELTLYLIQQQQATSKQLKINKAIIHRIKYLEQASNKKKRP